MHPVQRPVKRLILLGQRLERTAKYVSDVCPGPSLQGGRCFPSGDESEASGLDPTGPFVLRHVCHLMGRVLEVSRQAGLKPGQVAFKL